MARARVLIAGDERQTVDELRDHLELCGFEPEVALSAQLALSILEERRMDLCILGAKVQDMEGPEALKRFRELDSRLPVILLTQEKSKRYHNSLLKAGARGVLTLPLDRGGLLKLVEDVLKHPERPPTPKKKRSARASRKGL